MTSRKRIPISIAALLLVSGMVFSALAVPYEVKIENLIPGGPDTGQPMTPPVVVVHGPGYAIFHEGDFASAALEALAEDGVTGDLVAEANASPHVYDVMVGGGPFFDMVTVMVDGSPGDLLSLVTMLARSNDLFTGVNAVSLPDNTISVYEPTSVWDAGTEENTGMVEHIPFYGNPFVGPDETVTITAISAYSVVNDPVHKMIDYEFPPSARITITPFQSTATEETTWGGIKSLFK